MATTLPAAGSPIGEPAPTLAPAQTFAPGRAPATLTERGRAMCRLIAFSDAFEVLPPADRAYFGAELGGLLGGASLAAAELEGR